MRLLRRWIRILTGAGEMSGVTRPKRWLIDWIRGETDGPVTVSAENAVSYAPVWYAVRRITGHVAQMPLVLYARAGDRRKRRASEHPAYRLVKSEPNGLMTASVFRELVQYHALIWGNGRAAIDRDARGNPVALMPLMPWLTVTVLVNGEKWHVATYLDDAGQQRQLKFRDEHVIHIQGLGADGVVGYPLWELAKRSWGLGLASEHHAARVHRNNAVPGLLLEAPAGVFRDDEEAKKFLSLFREMHEGADNAGRTALLREGVKASKLSFTPEEAQAIESRMFQRQEVALWFLLEAITGDDKSVSYSSLEQKHLAYLINCLNGWLVKWTEQCERKLLTLDQRRKDSHFFRFSTGALLRADMATTISTLVSAVRGEIMTRNEARDIIDLDAIEGGDDLSNPAITTKPETKGAP